MNDKPQSDPFSEPLVNRPTIHDEMRRWREANPHRKKDFQKIQETYESYFPDMEGPHEVKAWLEAHPAQSREAMALSVGITLDGQINGRGELDDSIIAEELGISVNEVDDLLTNANQLVIGGRFPYGKRVTDERELWKRSGEDPLSVKEHDDIASRVDLLKRAQANGGILPLDLTDDELKLAKQMKEEGLFDAPDGGRRNTPTFKEFREISLEQTKQMSTAGILEGFAGYEYREGEDDGDLEVHVKKIYEALNDEELEIFSRLMGFSKQGEKQSSSTMQKPEQIAEELGMTRAEVMAIADNALAKVKDEKSSHTLNSAEEWLNASDRLTENSLELVYKEEINEEHDEWRTAFWDDGLETSSQMDEAKELLQMMGQDPSTFGNPMELDDWVSAIVFWQSKIVRANRSSSGKEQLRKWLSNLRVAHSNMRSLPKYVEKRFTKLTLDSLRGELHGTTKNMVMAAEARVAEYDYVWLQKEELPSESGMVIIPEGAWPINYTHDETGDVFEGRMVAVSWTHSAGNTVLWFWDTIEAADGNRMVETLQHVWSCNPANGTSLGGMVRHPRLAVETFRELGILGPDEDWNDQTEQMFEMWSNMAKAAELIRMLGEEIGFTQKARPVFTDKNTKRQVKKTLEEIPDIIVYDLRRFAVNAQGKKEWDGTHREFSHSFDVRGHPRVLKRGTPEEKTVWVRPHRKAVDKPYIKKDRIGVLRR